MKTRIFIGVCMGFLSLFAACFNKTPANLNQSEASETNLVLLGLFKAHGIEGAPQDDWIVFQGRKARAKASIVSETPQPQGVSVQLDVSVKLEDGRVLIESLAGMGKDKPQAVAEGWKNFTANSLHVVLAAFFSVVDEEVTRETWMIDGGNRSVILGNIGMRGKFPLQGPDAHRWLNRLEETIKKARFDKQAHWIRMYYGHLQGRTAACEVLLDNAVWEEAQAEMNAFDWPSQQGFYSVRVLLVVQPAE